MHPALMAVLSVTLVGTFLYSARTRWASIRVGQRTGHSHVDRLGQRLGAVWTFGLAQKKMRYYPAAGIAHQLIFLGFVVLLLRSLVLFTRGFMPHFELGSLLPEGAWARELARWYAFAKDLLVGLVLFGVGVFGYLRLISRPPRLKLNAEGLLILAIIACMMLADVTYDGALLVLSRHQPALCAGTDAWCARAVTVILPLGVPAEPGWRLFPDPAGSALAMLFADLGTAPLVVLAYAGFWTHVTLVLLFLNLLPYSKHFHVLTALPNIFLGDLGPPGRLGPLAPSSEQLMELVERAIDTTDPTVSSVGCARLEHLTWKDRLDLFTCTECGRCSDNCPATLTGKRLDPRQFTLDLRRELKGHKPAGDLVPQVIQPDVLWACTTCRACEEQCPVGIGYVGKIVGMRQNLVMMRGDHFPSELTRLFEALETNGNPWNLAREDRARWAEGLGVATAADHPAAEVLLWVGCAASYDPRAQKVARALALLLRAAGVDFAILGQEESCTGDAARRAGNEYLFLTLAERNLETLARYQSRGGVRQIVTPCPHCRHTLEHEYPDLGGRFRVTSHASFLWNLLEQGRLVPKQPLVGGIVYHDSCYLGRYAGEYSAPRSLIDHLPGSRRVEPTRFAREHGFCCGAGGAQMWLDEQNERRVNAHRMDQLAATGANVVASACPYCLVMLRDALASRRETLPGGLEGSILEASGSEKASTGPAECHDIAELLAESCGLSARLKNAS